MCLFADRFSWTTAFEHSVGRTGEAREGMRRDASRDARPATNLHTPCQMAIFIVPPRPILPRREGAAASHCLPMKRFHSTQHHIWRGEPYRGGGRGVPSVSADPQWALYWGGLCIVSVLVFFYHKPVAIFYHWFVAVVEEHLLLLLHGGVDDRTAPLKWDEKYNPALSSAGIRSVTFRIPTKRDSLCLFVARTDRCR